MTIEQDIKAEIVAIRTKADADIAALEAHLAGGGGWLQQEKDAAYAEWTKLCAYFHAGAPAPEAAPNPPPAPPAGA